MFNKLKSFSEDVAKSLNDMQQGETNRKSLDSIRQLKSGASILNTKTPESKDLLQPEDENGSKNGSQAQLNEENASSKDQPLETTSSIPTSGPLKDIDMEQLPQLVRAKLKKFVKYEEKYPVLLDAYKTEKRKGELVLVFEKVLKENTPVSTIADAGELVEFLKSLNEKTSMTEQELRRKTAEASLLTKRLAEAEKVAKYSEESLGKTAKAKDALAAEVEELKKKLESGRTSPAVTGDADGELQKSIDTLKEQLGSSKVELAAVIEERDDVTEKLKRLEEEKDSNASVAEERDNLAQKIKMLEEEKDSTAAEIKKLQSEVEALVKEKEQNSNEKDTQRSAIIEQKDELQKNLDALLSEKSKLSTQNEELKKAVADLEKKAQEMEDKIQAAVKEKDEALANLSQAAPSPEPATPQQTSQRGGKKKKNKKGKSSSPASQVEQEQPKPAENGNSELQEKHDELLKKYDTLTKERDSLWSEIREHKKAVESRDEKIDFLTDQVREIGNDLVTAKDELKNSRLSPEAEKKLQLYDELEKRAKLTSDELNQLRQDTEAQLKRLESERLEHAEKAKKEAGKEFEQQIETSNEQIKKLQQEGERSSEIIKSLREQLSNVTKDLESSKKEIDSLNAEKNKMNERIEELTKVKSADSSLRLEIASLQSSVAHKDELISDYRAESKKQTEERDNLKAKISQLEASNSSLQTNNKQLIQEKSELINNKEVTTQRINSLNTELTKLQVSRHEVIGELEKLKEKYDAMMKSKTNSADEIQTYRQQYDELNMKLKEAQLRIDSLEDELTETKHMLQERTRESSMIRKLLLDAEERHNIECANLKNEIRSINELKAEIESSLQSSLKHKQREIDDLKARAAESVKKIKELTEETNDLKKKLEPLLNESAISPEAAKKTKDLENTIEELRNSLQSSSAKVKEFENMNRVLKKLNEETSLKFERLLKNYKHVTQQYRQMQSVKSTPPESTRSSSDQSPSGTESDKDTNVAYLKNVLLGFFEHKEQRELLLPVVKTLFQLDEKEETKLLSALK